MSVNRRQLFKLSQVIDALYVEAMNSPVMKKQAREDLRSGFLVTAMDKDEADDLYEPEHSFDEEMEEMEDMEGLEDLDEDYEEEDVPEDESWEDELLRRSKSRRILKELKM